ncbi:2-haloacid dehalogenase [Geodermatophilus tzadiensis]|uniref:2-haloacid dehalogenase n=1 Tax=Geodermatophilus tzadiensis TaxID=1137988 RepID=A0A2T0TTD1_9ACTN|nr:haloacid dehalogenase [Geodermatophilus tzadiensis]PRY48954.1 2-haloacid dehalogenase [Geodermatophilus tzadiensis]
MHATPVHSGSEPSRLTVALVRSTPGARTHWSTWSLPEGATDRRPDPRTVEEAHVEQHPRGALVTFDLFSALVDSRAGGSAVFADLARRRGWPLPGERVYDVWDRRNKASQRDLTTWVPFTEHSRRALAGAYAELGLAGDAGEDVGLLLGSVGDWPLWPDVATGLPAVARQRRTGVLSNVDDAVFARTRVAALVPDAEVLTSERLGAYKPAREIYRRAREQAGELVHVATSARDVRGALEAGIPVVRLRRPGHHLDADGPPPAVEVDDLHALLAALRG